MDASTACNSRTTRWGFFSECSQMRCTRQPSLRRIRLTSLSRALFRPIFGSQKFCRDLGIRQCHRQPCQKQPSTKTVTRSFRNTKSGLPGSRWFRRQPRIPFPRRIVTSLSSVSLFPFERTAAMTRDRFFLENTSGIRFFYCEQTLGNTGQMKSVLAQIVRCGWRGALHAFARMAALRSLDTKSGPIPRRAGSLPYFIPSAL